MATAPAYNPNITEKGTIAQVIGAVVDVTFAGELPAIRVCKSFRVPDEALRQYLEASVTSTDRLTS